MMSRRLVAKKKPTVGERVLAYLTDHPNPRALKSFAMKDIHSWYDQER